MLTVYLQCMQVLLAIMRSLDPIWRFRETEFIKRNNFQNIFSVPFFEPCLPELINWSRHGSLVSNKLQHLSTCSLITKHLAEDRKSSGMKVTWYNNNASSWDVTLYGKSHIVTLIPCQSLISHLSSVIQTQCRWTQAQNRKPAGGLEGSRTYGHRGIPDQECEHFLFIFSY